MAPSKIDQVSREVSKGGYFPFKPIERTRSEASFSEFHYDNTEHPAAGVCSARLWHHHSKDCSDDTAHISQVERVMRMTPEQEYNCQFESLEGKRMDPATIGVSAGDLSKKTKVKVTLLAGHDQDTDIPGMKQKRAQGYILDISRKATPASKPPKHCSDPLRPLEEKFNRPMKRTGYDHSGSKQTWTWNECNESSGLSPEFVNMHDPNQILKGLSPVSIKMHTSSKGEKRYNVCGVQDMLPAAQEKFIKCDAPPSARHIYENNKNGLQGFERGAAPKGGSGPEFLTESPGMWNCMAGKERPLDEWRSRTGGGGDPAWMDSAESYYSGNESVGVQQAFNSQPPTPRYDATRRIAPGSQSGTPRDYMAPRYNTGSRRSLLSSPSQNQFLEQEYQGDRTLRPGSTRRSLLSASPSQSSFYEQEDRGDRTQRGNRRSPSQQSLRSPSQSSFYEQEDRGDRTQRTQRGDRRSILSSPSASEFSGPGARSGRGSRTSRASMTSSALEIAQRPRWQ